MNVLASELAAKLAPGMTVPGPIAALYDWMEASDLFVDTESGRIGILFSGNGPCGTGIEFMAQGNANMRHWFGRDDPAINDRLCVFARTGHDGSMAAFWLDDEGRQRIVHLGSGSGSTLVCVLADDPLDFLRLLAIGYDEICWGAFEGEPDEADGRNEAYRDWLVATFDATIPESGASIVPEPAFIESEVSTDPFWRWVKTQLA